MFNQGLRFYRLVIHTVILQIGVCRAILGIL